MPKKKYNTIHDFPKTKVCRDCNKPKDIKEFTVASMYYTKKNGARMMYLYPIAYCRSCFSKRNAASHARRTEEQKKAVAAYRKAWGERKKTIITEPEKNRNRAYHRQYYADNPDKFKVYYKSYFNKRKKLKNAS